jgi:hypothetical protein
MAEDSPDMALEPEELSRIDLGPSSRHPTPVSVACSKTAMDSKELQPVPLFMVSLSTTAWYESPPYGLATYVRTLNPRLL